MSMDKPLTDADIEELVNRARKMSKHTILLAFRRTLLEVQSQNNDLTELARAATEYYVNTSSETAADLMLALQAIR